MMHIASAVLGVVYILFSQVLTIRRRKKCLLRAFCPRNTILTEIITSENKYKSQEFGFSLCRITKAKAKKNLWDFIFIRRCGLLLWLVRAQHDHYESEYKRKSRGIYLPFHYESESEIKSSDFHL